MAITLTATSNTISKTALAPQDTVDDVSMTSINPGLQTLLNNSYYLARTMVYLRPHVSISSIASNTTVTIAPYKGLWVSTTAVGTETWTSFSNTSSTNITGTSVEGGGGYVASSTYYLYFLGATATFQLSLTPPDATGTFKVVAGVEQIDQRYIGSVLTDISSKIIPFKMTDFEYTFAVPYPSNYGNGTLTSVTYVDVIWTQIPVLVKDVTLAVTFINGLGTTGINSTYFASKGLETVPIEYIVQTSAPTTTGGVRYLDMSGIKLPLGTNQRLAAHITANFPIYIFALGWSE